MSKDDLIATGEVPMCDLANLSADNTNTGVLSVPLEPKGEIRVMCKFNLDEACAGTEARDAASHNYGQRRGITDILILEARDLKSCNFIRSMDPYARVTINDVSKNSHVHDNGHKNPSWNEELPAFMVANVDADIVTIELWDKDSMSKDDLIATGEVPMCDLANLSADNINTGVLSVPLEPKGEIRVMCKFNLDEACAGTEARDAASHNYGMRRGITDILIIEARDLKSCNFIRSMDPYARVTINDVSKNSRVHDNGHKNPSWNEELPAFMVANVDADTVTIELWDKDSMSKDDLIATGEVPMCDLANAARN